MHKHSPLTCQLQCNIFFWSLGFFTLLDTPVQQEQQACVSLTAHVVVQHEWSDAGKSHQSLQLESLLLTGGPVTCHGLPLRQGSRGLHEGQQSQNNPFLFIDLWLVDCLGSALHLQRALQRPELCVSPVLPPSRLTWWPRDSTTISSFENLLDYSWSWCCTLWGCDFSLMHK